MTRIQTILVGTDGSETACAAVARAAEMASKTGAVLHLVMAYKTPSVKKLEARRASLPEEFRYSVSADSEAQGIVRNAAEHASRMGVEVETHLATGNPAKVILNSAKDLGADIVVVGRKRVERRIRRSVSQDDNLGFLLLQTTPARSARRYDFGRGRRASERRPQTATSLVGASG
jgi:nucleotide-binding universal stress UspA family protein